MSPRQTTPAQDFGVPNPLPCRHQVQVIEQIQPTVDLLRHMDTQYPDLLRRHRIEPQDYHGGLVFRSAVESIRGSYIASSTPFREKYVADILSALRANNLIHDFDQLSASQRWDFEVFPEPNEAYTAVIEVKGGEGNSINISVRSRTVKEFAVWSHLDGSIQHHPSHSARAIIGRLTNELSARGKQVDILFFKDVLCGTRARPCPKYPGREDQVGALTAPDVYLFPQRVPTLDDPQPPVHTTETVRLPKILLDHFSIPPSDYYKHIWEVHLELVQRNEDGQNRLQRLISVRHQGKEVFKGRGKPFRPVEQ